MEEDHHQVDSEKGGTGAGRLRRLKIWVHGGWHCADPCFG